MTQWKRLFWRNHTDDEVKNDLKETEVGYELD